MTHDETPQDHSRIEGFLSLPGHCAQCGAQLTLVYYATDGKLWTGCPNDPGLKST